jgi:hypothetical protein
VEVRRQDEIPRVHLHRPDRHPRCMFDFHFPNLPNFALTKSQPFLSNSHPILTLYARDQATLLLVRSTGNLQENVESQRFAAWRRWRFYHKCSYEALNRHFCQTAVISCPSVCPKCFRC